MGEPKPIEVDGVEEQEVKKILNKRKIQGVEKYLVRWKGFMAEYNTWEKEKDLENARGVIEEFKEKMSMEIRRQERLNRIEEKDFKRGQLPEKYMAKMLYEQDNRKFEKEYLRKLERNWQKWKSVSPEEKS